MTLTSAWTSRLFLSQSKLSFFLKKNIFFFSFSLPSNHPDTSLQLRRDVIFCQAVTGAVCTLAEQLLAALRSRFNNAGEYQEDGKETSRKWLEQISVIGALLHFQSTLAPHVVSGGFFCLVCFSSSLFRIQKLFFIIELNKVGSKTEAGLRSTFSQAAVSQKPSSEQRLCE